MLRQIGGYALLSPKYSILEKPLISAVFSSDVMYISVYITPLASLIDEQTRQKLRKNLINFPVNLYSAYSQS